MASALTAAVDRAVATMRSGSDHDALRALLGLAAEPPTAVLEALIDRLLEHEPPSGRAGKPAAVRLPDDGTIAQVYEVLAQTDAPGLMDLGGGTYDGMVALLVATLAAVDDSAADRTGAPS